MKQTYKELRKKLDDAFVNDNRENAYYVVGSVGKWVAQCGMEPTAQHLRIICSIMGSVPYPYQKADRKKILTYLKNNKYKDYKNDI